MRQIETKKITETVARLCKHANYFLPGDVWRLLNQAHQKETASAAQWTLSQILENARLSSQRETALCQDTGMAEIFLTVGQELQVTGGGLYEAINKGVALGYGDGYLRNSIVSDPIERKNTGNNTPAHIYTEIVPGDTLEITLLAKGGGSENASAVKMLTPSDGMEGIKAFVLETVKVKGKNACPPLIIGVGIGGSFSSVAVLAKKALLRDLDSAAQTPQYEKLEKEILAAVNSTGIGPMGLGGVSTALAVTVKAAPCHIASLPVAVCLQCHSCRKIREVM